MSTDCIFCGIVSGTLPASVVYRDDVCMAFMDIQPVNPGHVLIVPNQHATYLKDMPVATGGHLFQTAQRLATALRASGVQCEGINLFLADGEAAMQEVFHVHLHVIPRYKGDGFGLRFGPHYKTRPERTQLDEGAQMISRVLGAA